MGKRLLMFLFMFLTLLSFSFSVVFKVTITNPNNYNLTDYQVRIDLSSYLNQATNLEVCSDLSNCSETLLPFCYEQSNGECNTNPSTIIWVKVPLVPKATKAVDGDQVFDFYDDFNDGVLNSSKWTFGGTNTNRHYKVSGGALKLWAEGSNVGGYDVTLCSATSFATNLIIESRMAFTRSDSTTNMGLYFIKDSSWIGLYGGQGSAGLYTTTSGFHSLGIYGWGNYYTYGLKITNNNVVGYIVGGQSVSATLSVDNINVCFEVGIPYQYLSVDWIRVRKYADQEPTVSVNETAKTITITNPNNYDLTDFQVRIPFNKPVYDIQLNGQTVPFCFEHSNGECNANPNGVQAIWIKINISAGSNITLTYNDTLVSTVIYIKTSNTNCAVSGGNVFDFYDDFNEASINTSKWTIHTTSSYAQVYTSNGLLVLKLTGGANEIAEIISKTQFNPGIVIETRGSTTYSGWYIASFFGLTSSPTTADWYSFRIREGLAERCDNSCCYPNCGDYFAISSDVRDDSGTFKFRKELFWDSTTHSSNGFWFMRIKWKENFVRFEAQKDGYTSYYLTEYSDTNINAPKYLFIQYTLWYGGVSGTTYYDWIRVRKYADIEPSINIKLFQVSVSITNKRSEEFVSKVNVSVNILNTYDNDINTTIYYLLNGNLVRSENVSILAGSSITLNHTYEILKKGTYNITVKVFDPLRGKNVSDSFVFTLDLYDFNVTYGNYTEYSPIQDNKIIESELIFKKYLTIPTFDHRCGCGSGDYYSENNLIKIYYNQGCGCGEVDVYSIGNYLYDIHTEGHNYETGRFYLYFDENKLKIGECIKLEIDYVWQDISGYGRNKIDIAGNKYFYCSGCCCYNDYDKNDVYYFCKLEENKITIFRNGNYWKTVNANGYYNFYYQISGSDDCCTLISLKTRIRLSLYEIVKGKYVDTLRYNVSIRCGVLGHNITILADFTDANKTYTIACDNSTKVIEDSHRFASEGTKNVWFYLEAVNESDNRYFGNETFVADLNPPKLEIYPIFTSEEAQSLDSNYSTTYFSYFYNHFLSYLCNSSIAYRDGYLCTPASVETLINGYSSTNNLIPAVFPFVAEDVMIKNVTVSLEGQNYEKTIDVDNNKYIPTAGTFVKYVYTNKLCWNVKACDILGKCTQKMACYYVKPKLYLTQSKLNVWGSYREGFVFNLTYLDVKDYDLASNVFVDAILSGIDEQETIKQFNNLIGSNTYFRAFLIPKDDARLYPSNEFFVKVSNNLNYFTKFYFKNVNLSQDGSKVNLYMPLKDEYSLMQPITIYVYKDQYNKAFGSLVKVYQPSGGDYKLIYSGFVDSDAKITVPLVLYLNEYKFVVSYGGKDYIIKTSIDDNPYKLVLENTNNILETSTMQVPYSISVMYSNKTLTIKAFSSEVHKVCVKLYDLFITKNEVYGYCFETPSTLEKTINLSSLDFSGKLEAEVSVDGKIVFSKDLEVSGTMVNILTLGLLMLINVGGLVLVLTLAGQSILTVFLGLLAILSVDLGLSAFLPIPSQVIVGIILSLLIVIFLIRR